MYISPEDARSDVILTVAAVVLGRFALSLLAQVPGYPASGWPYLLLSLLWLAVLSGATPWLLARHRNDVPGAFSMGPKDRGSVTMGLVVALPLLVGHVLPSVFSGRFGSLLFSLTGNFTIDQPTISAYEFNSIAIYLLLAVPVLALGSWLFASLLAVRSRDAFRSPDADLTELVRTFGMGGVGVSLVLGLLNTARDPDFFAEAMLVTAVLLAIVLLTDQYVPARVTTRRAALVGPMVVVVVLYVLAAGGLFRGDLLTGLYTGATAAVVMLCAAALAEVRQGTATAILVVASVIYPVGGLTMQPLPLPLLLP